MIAAIYARKSTDQSDRADDAKSVTRQIENARAFAAARGWTVDPAHVYADDGVSGGAVKKLVGRQRLLDVIASGRAPFDVLILRERSRFSRRDGDESFAELKQIARAGVQVWFYLNGQPFEFGTMPLNVMGYLEGEFAAEHRRVSAAHSTEAALRLARAGYVAGGRCFGYQNVREAGGVRRVIDPIEAEIVRRIFALAASGLGLVTIAKTLNAERAVSPRPQQGRPAGWAPSSVREVLHRTAYMGRLEFNRTQKRDSAGDVHQRPRSAAEWVTVALPETAILTAEQWDAAHQAMDASRARYGHIAAPWGRQAKYLLTGLLTCGACGSGL
jgi:site-specific DNA recombinase